MFATSTHAKDWLFTTDELRDIRSSVAAGSFLTSDEETKLKRHHESKIQEICKKLGLPPKVHITAVCYFKRFYLRQHVYEWDPKHIMLSCIYLACKVEECKYSIQDFTTQLKVLPASILEHELPVLSEMKFQLTVFSPIRALDGFVDDAKKNAPGTLTEKHAVRAHKHVDQCLLTECPLLYSPSQIALAALCVAAKRGKANTDAVKRYMESVYATSPDYEKLLLALTDIERYIEEGSQATNLDEVRQIDRKMRKTLKKNEKAREHKKEEQKERKRKIKQVSRDSLDAEMGLLV
eukprot:TRINITY_DN6855_c0_g1_i2.p1 TRINITY_DN6855_c0_g1~~TRINITY_DN6855_c0_g1_i2.p1  ORF type:complete len:301 (+),score=76.52 TRINITY_DN6855_c0_g1_i2:26-904(+)